MTGHLYYANMDVTYQSLVGCGRLPFVALLEYRADQAFPLLSNAHDQNGQLRIRLRNHHRTTPWCIGTDFTKWIMERYQEMHQQRMRARSASAAPSLSPSQDSRPLPSQHAPPVGVAQNAIDGPPHGEYRRITSALWACFSPCSREFCFRIWRFKVGLVLCSCSCACSSCCSMSMYTLYHPDRQAYSLTVIPEGLLLPALGSFL